MMMMMGFNKSHQALQYKGSSHFYSYEMMESAFSKKSWSQSLSLLQKLQSLLVYAKKD